MPKVSCKLWIELWIVIYAMLAGQAFGGLRDAPLPDDLFVTDLRLAFPTT